jgi:hypothetical protein
MKSYFGLAVFALLLLSFNVYATEDDYGDDDTFNLKAIKSMRLKSAHESRRSLRSLRGLSNVAQDDDYLLGADDDYITRDDDNFGDDQNDDDILPADINDQFDDDFWH